MNTIFSTPDIRGNFENLIHRGGEGMPKNERLITLQEGVLREGITLGSDRRHGFINIKTPAETDIQDEMQQILRQICQTVADRAATITGKKPVMDDSLSAIWIEESTSPMNLIVHRDASEVEIVRATFSVSPTRFLPADVVIPVDEEEWCKRRYPMGPVLLHGRENMTTTGALGGVGLMTGTTYHRGPRPDEVLRDFSELFGASGLKEGKIPRIFGSIWGRIPK